EPFGLVMIEAMAAGTPVVALRRGSVPEVVEHGVTGVVVDRPDELAAAIAQARRLDPAVCRKHVETCFSVPAMAQRYESAYRCVLAGVPCQPLAGLFMPGRNPLAPVDG
ncbi:MAG TPA: glycosyltransferase, partial [Streptosporangiaceae bacterium]|nr:glycosyltransferase [Streptosporangiaceae bacterium]